MSAVAGSETKLAFRAAVEARDHAALVEAFAPDAVVRGFNSDRGLIRGREEIGALYSVLWDVLQDIRFTDEFHSPEGTALVMARARVDGTDVQIADHMKLDEHGRILELTVFFRPTPAIAVAARALGAALARRKSPARGRFVGLIATPLVAQTRLQDRFADRVVKSSLS